PRAVLGVVVVPLAGEAHLARDRHLRLVVAQHRDLHLAGLDAALDDDPAVVARGEVDRGAEVLRALDLADPDARAEVGRLHEAGVADRARDVARDRSGLALPVV